MGFVLDAIIKRILIPEDELITDNYITESINVSGVDQAYMVQFDYYEGDGSVSGNISLEVSLDNKNFVPYDLSEIEFEDDNGTFIWDVSNSGAVFIRLNIELNAGQFRAKANFSGKRRH